MVSANCNGSPGTRNKFDLIAVQGTRIIGWGFVWDLDRQEPFFGLGVADAYHSRGWGGRLMDGVLAAMHQRGLKRLHLTVVTDNVRARRLYNQRGFVYTGEFTGSDGLPYYRMVADLDRASPSGSV